MAAELSAPRSVVTVVRHFGPLVLCSEQFRADQLRHRQWFVCVATHLQATSRARTARRIWGGG